MKNFLALNPRNFLHRLLDIIPSTRPGLLLSLALGVLGLNATAAPGTVVFGNHNGSKVINGHTGAAITTNMAVRVALYWSPLGTNSFAQIGPVTNVGFPVPGIFAGGTRTCGAGTTGGTAGQFQVRAWSGGFATYEQALATTGILIGQSAIVQVVTGNPGGDPPMAPASLLAGGLSSFSLLTNSSTPLSLVCASNKTVACGDLWLFDAPITTGGCITNPSVIVSSTITNGACPWLITRTWQATDGCTTNVCSQTVIVVDTTPPTLVCASNKIVECGSAWAFDPPQASDTCSGSNVAVTVLGTISNGTCPQIITRTWLAMDACGNSNTCNQIVTVMDATPPTLTCASNKTVECGSVWTFDPPQANDACSGTNVSLTVLNTLTNGICPQLLTRSWLATDACGNSNTCQQIVTVVDSSPLVFTCPTNKTADCATNWSFDAPLASASCGSNVVVLTLTTVTNNFCPQLITRSWSITNTCNSAAALCSQTVTVLCPDCPVIAVTKTCPPNPVPPGGILTFTGTITNLSVFTLTNVIVLNDQPASNTLVFGPATLAPGASATFSSSYTVSPLTCGAYADTLLAIGTIPGGLTFSNSVTASCPRATVITPGDRNGDGIVDQAELNAVLANYWPNSPWLYLTNTVGLGGTNVTFALTNSTAGAFSIEYTTNLTDWEYLGPATPRYEFTDTNAPAMPQRFYRLRWP